MGKAYANRKKESERPENDFYQTPYSLTKVLVETGILDNCHHILEPACGQGAISRILEEYGFEVTSRDLVLGNDFLLDDYSNEKYDAIVTNPPFDLWDKFVEKAKTINCNKIIFIGRLNYFGGHARNVNGIWNGLSDIYVFDRMVAYDKVLREDGKFETGCLVTGWFVWTNQYSGEPKVHILDVQDYVVSKKEKQNENQSSL